MVEILEVKNNSQKRDFINFPNELYKREPNYVPSIYLSVKWQLSKKNPFFQHSKAAYFLAKRENKIVGRIAAIYNKTHLNRYKDETGFFGFFDSIDDVEVSRLLFDVVSEWLKKKGLSRMIGPENLTTNDTVGALVEGFEYPPRILMPYNFSYYDKLIKSYGFKKSIDLFSYEIDGSQVIEKYSNVLERSQMVLNQKGINFRNISAENFKEDIAKLRPTYNKCNETNWGFMPLNEEEFKEMAYDLKRISPLDLSIIAEKDDKIIAFLIAVPNVNEAIANLKGGKLLPLGFLKLWWYKRKIKSARILILGVLPEYANMGIDMILYKKIKAALNARKIFTSEASYVMEPNLQMNSILQKIGGKQLKRYRLYQKEVNSKNESIILSHMGKVYNR